MQILSQMTWVLWMRVKLNQFSEFFPLNYSSETAHNSIEILECWDWDVFSLFVFLVLLLIKTRHLLSPNFTYPLRHFMRIGISVMIVKDQYRADYWRCNHKHDTIEISSCEMQSELYITGNKALASERQIFNSSHHSTVL